MADVNPTLSVTTININGRMHQFKGRNWHLVKKHNPIMSCLQQIHIRFKGKTTLKEKGWRKTCHRNTHQMRIITAILISDGINFRPAQSRVGICFFTCKM